MPRRQSTDPTPVATPRTKRTITHSPEQLALTASRQLRQIAERLERACVRFEATKRECLDDVAKIREGLSPEAARILARVRGEATEDRLFDAECVTCGYSPCACDQQ